MGTHVKVGKGLVGALASAGRIGAETMQVFVGNPRGWALSAGDPAEDARVPAAARESRGMRVFIHTPYLVNLGSPTASDLRAVGRRRRAQPQAARREIGAEGVVVHTGSFASDEGERCRRRRCGRSARACCRCWTRSPATTRRGCCSSRPPGQGRSLCAGVEDLEPYLAALDLHPKVGICLDTCHVFAAGAPLDEPGGTTATVDRIVEIARRRAGCGWCTPTTRWTCAARSRTGTRRSARATSARARSRSCSRTRRPPACRSSWRRPGSRDAGDPRSPLLKQLRERGRQHAHRGRRTTLLATLAAARRSPPAGARRSS